MATRLILLLCFAFSSPLISKLTTAQSVNDSPLYPVDASFFPDADQNCLAAYSANVTCPAFIEGLYNSLYTDFPSDALDDLCTVACYSSLLQHRSNVSSACTNSEIYDDFLSIYYAPTTWDDQALYAFNMTCLKRGSDREYCVDWFQAAQNTTTPGDCDSCNLESIELQVNSPFGEDLALASLFQSLTSSCQSTQYSIATPTATYLINNTAPVYQRNCSSTHQLKGTDTALSVSYAFNVSTADLLTINGMNSNSTFPQNGTLCIPPACGAVHVVDQKDTCNAIAEGAGITPIQLMSWNLQIGLCLDLSSFVNQTLCLGNPAGNFAAAATTTTNATGVFSTEAPVPTDAVQGSNTDCGEWYQVEAGDNCGTITEKFSISFEDFGFLNPEIDANCTNLFLNYSYCVAPVGTITSYSGYGPSSTSSGSFVGTSASALPWTNPIWSDNSTSAAGLVPIANGTRTDCWQYVFINGSTPDLSTCGMFALGFNMDPNDLTNWNPSLATQTSNTSSVNSTVESCTISTSVSYCVQLASPTPAPPASTVPPSPIAAGSPQDCTQYGEAFPEIDCASFYTSYYLTLAEFYALNPTVNSDCSALFSGTWYCMSVDPQGFNTPPNNNPNITSVSSSPISTSTESSPSPTTTGSNGVVTPTPTQSGMATDCVKFYDVQQGDSCYAVAQNNSIALNDFYNWNPAVGTDCSGLDYGFYVCVGVSTSATTSATATATISSASQTPGTQTSRTSVSTPTPTQTGMASGCDEFYKAVQGDTCSGIASNYSLSLQTFIDWNPAVKSDCSDLEAGVYYCVSGPSTT